MEAFNDDRKRKSARRLFKTGRKTTKTFIASFATSSPEVKGDDWEKRTGAHNEIDRLTRPTDDLDCDKELAEYREVRYGL